MTIPPVFHVTTKDKQDLRPSFRSNLDRMRRFYPDHEIRIHDDDDILDFLRRHHARYFDDVIQRMPSFIMVVDTVRYAWMSSFGGVYADLDIRLNRALPLRAPVVLVEREWTWPQDDAITDSVHNCFFASEQGHPVWDDLLTGIAAKVQALPSRRPSRLERRVVRSLRRRLHRPVVDPVFTTTGPNAISQIITRGRLLQRHPDVLVEPASVLFQQNFSKRPAGPEFMVHETAGSWAG